MLIDQINQSIKEVDSFSMTVTAEDVKKYTDLACLGDNVSNESIKEVCELATAKTHCAGVCVFPGWIEICRDYLIDSEVKVAAALNFPDGLQDSKEVRKNIDKSIVAGAQEIDIVFPYGMYLETKAQAYKQFEVIFEHIAKRAYTKVIIETGAFGEDYDTIYDLTSGMIDLGVDMIKTSTGMHEQGASLGAAAAILFAIKNHGVGAVTGLKVSGGIRTCDDASKYARLYQRVINRDWRNANRLRFGASKLIT